MQIMLEILLMVLQSTMTDETKFDDKCEMSVNNGLHGWTGDGKPVGLSDDMEKVQVGSPNDMDVESVGSSGEVCFECGRRESGVRWWGRDPETVPDRAR